MASFLLHILKALWHRRVTGFWPIWTTITGTAAICAAWVVRYPKGAAVAGVRKSPPDRAKRYARSSGSVALLVLVFLLLAGYAAESFQWENFADGDDQFFTLGTLKGQNLAPTILPEQGRFFPLAHQEFNVIRRFTGSVAGYHALPLAQLSIVCCLLLILDDELRIGGRAALASVFLILPSTIVSFTELVIPERNVMFCLICLLLFVKFYDQNLSPVWAAAAVLSAQAMIYYKETAFLLLLGFAAGRFFFRWWHSDQSVWNQLGAKENRLDLCLIFLALLFLPYYAAVMTPHLNMRYADQQRVSPTFAILYYTRLDLLAWCLVGTFLRRSYLILRRREIPVPFWDGLALGGVAVFAAYLYLRLTAPYYLAPVDVIALLYVGRFALLSFRKMHVQTKTAVLVSALIVVLQALSFSAFILFERKNVIHAKAQIADVILARYRSGTGDVQRLFFPFSNGYYITEFASYLTYRGLPIERAKGQSVEHQVTLLTNSDVLAGNPCYSNFVCYPRTAPLPGDLIIELPDDEESLSAINRYRNEGIQLFSYEPRPRILQSLIPFANFFHIASTPFERKQLPDRWLHASVTEIDRQP